MNKIIALTALSAIAFAFAISGCDQTDVKPDACWSAKEKADVAAILKTNVSDTMIQEDVATHERDPATEEKVRKSMFDALSFNLKTVHVRAIDKDAHTITCGAYVDSTMKVDDRSSTESATFVSYSINPSEGGLITLVEGDVASTIAHGLNAHFQRDQ